MVTPGFPGLQRSHSQDHQLYLGEGRVLGGRGGGMKRRERGSWRKKKRGAKRGEGAEEGKMEGHGRERKEKEVRNSGVGTKSTLRGRGEARRAEARSPKG